MKKLIFTLSVVCICLMFVSAFASDAVLVKLKEFNIPNSIAASFQAVNGAGTIVGWSRDKSGVFHCLIINRGNIQLFDHPATTDTRCYGINSKGDLVGSYLYMPTNKVRGFYYHVTPLIAPTIMEWLDINPPGALHSWATAINDRGEIVGSFTTTDGVTHAFLWNGTRYRTMDHPQAGGTEAAGINNYGTMTMRWWGPDWTASKAMHSAIFDGTQFRGMDMPGAKATFVQNISDTGDVVLYFRGADSRFHGALLHNQQFHTFSFPHAVNTYGMGLNSAGMLVGSFEGATPAPTAFVGLYAVQSLR